MKTLKVALKKLLLASIVMFPVCLSAATTTDDIGVKINSYSSPDGYCTVRLFWSMYDKTNPGTDNIKLDGKDITVNSSEVIRDGVTVVSDVPWTVYIDTPVAAGDHKYQIKMNLMATWNDELGVLQKEYFDAISDITTIPVEARNVAKVKYEIREIYNFRIGQENAANSANNSGIDVTNMYIPTSDNSTNVPYFEMTDFVRGCYHTEDGYWFFVDNGFGNTNLAGKSESNPDRIKWMSKTRSNQIIYRVKDDPISLTTPSAYEKLYEDATGTFTATSAEGTKTTIPGYYSKYFYIAVDNSHNIFSKGNTGAMYAAPRDYTVRQNGNYSSQKTGSLQIGAKFTDDESLLGNDNDKSQKGRCDYICCRGNLFSGNAEILLSPKRSAYLYRVKLNNGNLASESWTSAFAVDANYPGSSENYSFFVDGPNNTNRYIHQTRSNSLEVLKINEDGVGQLKDKTEGSVINYFGTTGQVNNTGGATLYFKGYSYHNDIYCNDLFITTPMGLGSVSSGSFQVNLAHRPSTTSTDDEFEFNDKMSPIGIFAQREESFSKVGTNANSSMFYMTKEVAKDSEGHIIYHKKRTSDGLVDDLDNPQYRLFIYQYVPLYRIAKYEIVPIFEPTYTEITIDIQKKFDETGTNVLGFSDKLYFYKPDYDGGDYVIKGYDIVLTTPDGRKYHYVAKPTTSKDENGQFIFKCEIHEMELVDGNWVDNGKPAQQYGEDGRPVFDEATGAPINYGTTYFTPLQNSSGTEITYEYENEFVKYYELPFPITSLGRYTADISVIIGPQGTPDEILCTPHQSYIDITMDVVDPVVTAKYAVLETIDSEPDVEFPIRTDVSFKLEEGTHDPVSYYALFVKTPDGNMHEITCEPYYCLVVDSEGNPVLDGAGNYQLVEDTRTEFERGVWVIDNGLPTQQISNKAPGQCPQFGSKDDDGTYPREPIAKIPGSYDFDNNPGYPLIENGNPEGMEGTVFSIYLTDPLTEADKVGKTDQEIKELRNSLLEQYEYIIMPIYAADTAFEMETIGGATATYGGTTGIEDVEADEISVFPVPADSEITVTAPFEIKEVKFYSVSGAVVKTATFAGDSDEVTISVQNLSSGFYYLSINGSRSVKFIKR